MLRSCLSGLLAFVLLASARVVVAQARFDSIMTPRGKCAVWVSIPGTSNGNDAVNRCALDKGLLLLTPELVLPAPRTELRAHGWYTVVVNVDGTVNLELTRPWSLSVDSAWNARTQETIRQWRFEPGIRNGVAVRSGFRLAITSAARNDTLASRLEWRREASVHGDSLIGTWVAEAQPTPFRADQVDSIHVALLRHPAGDYLKDWPVGFDEKTYRAWQGRCVADVPPAASVRIDCMILPDDQPDPDFTRTIHERNEPTTQDTAHQLAVIAMTLGAYQKDTLHVRLAEVPRVRERAVLDTVPACAGMAWGAYTQQDSAVLYIVKAEFEKLDRLANVHVTAVGFGRSPSSYRGGRCNAPNQRYRKLVAFALGDIGEQLRQPVTLCVQEAACRRSYTIDPAKHTLAREAHLRFNFADLRPDTRAGRQLVFRIYTNRSIPGQVPLVILRANNRWSAWIPREINPQEWEYAVSYADGYPRDAEVRVYLLVFD